MKNIKVPIPFHQMTFLQAYLYEVFAYEKQCKKSFENSKWYLKEKYSEEEVNSILGFFRSNNINCDCDIINKFDLREFSKGIVDYNH